MADRISCVAAVLLLAVIPGFAQSAFQNLVPGKSTRADVAAELGQPLRQTNGMVSEYAPLEGLFRIEAESGQESSSVVQRIGVTLAKPISRDALLRKFGLQTAATTKKDSDGRLIEFYGASALLGLTYVSGNPASGIGRIDYYSPASFASVIRPGGTQIAGSAAPGQSTAPAGYLGLTVGGVTDERVKALSLQDTHGAEVRRVAEGSPAARAGIREGDVILDVNGRAVEDFRKFVEGTRATVPGTRVSLGVWRNGAKQTLTATVEALPASAAAPAAPVQSAAPAGYLGLTVGGVTDERVKALNLQDTHGAEVRRVAEGSPAARAGLRKGDVILDVNGRAVNDFRQFTNGTRATAPGTRVRLRIRRGGGAMLTLTAIVGTWPEQAAAPAAPNAVTIAPNATADASGNEPSLEGVWTGPAGIEVTITSNGAAYLATFRGTARNMGDMTLERRGANWTGQYETFDPNGKVAARGMIVLKLNASGLLEGPWLREDGSKGTLTLTRRNAGADPSQTVQRPQ